MVSTQWPQDIFGIENVCVFILGRFWVNPGLFACLRRYFVILITKNPRFARRTYILMGSPALMAAIFWLKSLTERMG
jgi:hypothetical protein